MRAVVISKSPAVVVRPSEPVTGARDINLSTYDKWQVSNPNTVLFVFKHPIQDPVETIKRGLSQALVHYYPFAGRLAAGATAGEIVIKCTQQLELEGVRFVAASANCAMPPDLAADPWLQEELAVFYQQQAAGAGGNMCVFSDPLLMMQVTVFSCGGFVLGVTFNHAVADGVGMGQFLQAVGELSRGLPSPSVVPVRQQEEEDSIILGPPPVFTKFIQFLGSLQPSVLPVVEFTVMPSLINCIKDKFASINSGRPPCTVFEAMTAVLWRCRTRVIMSDPEAIMVLTVVANARKYAGAKEGYYGNCTLGNMVTATAGAVGNGDLMDLVRMIRCATKDVAPSQSDVDMLQMVDWYNILSVSSWRNLGFERMDFGAGGPARMMGCTRRMTYFLPSLTACISSCKDDDYNVVSICVKEEHATAFLHELAHTDLVGGRYIRSPL